MAKGFVKSTRWVKGVGELGEGLEILKEGQQATRLEQEAVRGVEVMKLLGQPIKQGPKQLEWIIAKHGPEQLTKYAGKSQFYLTTQVELEALIQNATHMSMKVQSGNGRIYRTVDAGKIIGFDSVTGKSTNFYSVITDVEGNLITAFPGFPIIP